MRKKKKTLNRATIAALSASMVAPSIAPAIPVFAEELTEISSGDMKDADKATPSVPDKNEDDNQDLPVTDEEIKDVVIDEEEEATASEPQKKKYPTFGTSAFWKWFDGLVAEICGDAA